MIEVLLSLLLKLLLVLAGAFAIAYLAACLYLFHRQKYFIFKPPSVIRATPGDFNLDYQEVWLPVSTASGNTAYIHAWWIPADEPDADVWLYLHGNGSNIGDEVARAVWFRQLGFSTFLFDYRGYGRSQDQFPTESSVYEDIEIIWNYLTQERQIPPERIFLYGHSLGGAIAIEMAIRHPEIAGLVVEASFTSMRTMVNHHYRHFLIFPVDLLLHQRFDSLSKVRRRSPPQASLQMPVLFIHGTGDRVVPAQMSEALYAAAPEPKKLLILPDIGHNDIRELGGTQYLEAVRWLIEQGRIKKRSRFVQH
ncbi:MAG TPA: alpha/beta fold hydrolase [Allocoleopsis sp.]